MWHRSRILGLFRHLISSINGARSRDSWHSDSTKGMSHNRVYWNSCLFHVAFQDIGHLFFADVHLCDKIVAAFLSFPFFFWINAIRWWKTRDFSGWRIEQFCNLITAWLESLEEFSGVTIRAVVRLFLSFICPLKIDVRFTMADNSADSTFCLWTRNCTTCNLERAW